MNSADKGPYSQSYGFSSSHGWMSEMDHKQGWAPENWIVVLEKTLESPLYSKVIKLVNPKGNQPWISLEGLMLNTPILWPPDAKSKLTGKDSDAGKDRREEEDKGMTEDEMVGWHHWLDGHEFEQTLGDSEGQGSLVCKASDTRMTEQQNAWTFLVHLNETIHIKCSIHCLAL